MKEYGISPEDLKTMQASIGNADPEKPAEEGNPKDSKTTNNRIMGDITGETGNVNFGDTVTNIIENKEDKPLPNTEGGTGGTTNTVNNRQIGDILGEVHGNVTVGDHNYNISLRTSDIEDSVMKDLADGKLAANTEAGSDYHKLSDSQKEEMKNKMRDAMDKKKADYMKSMPALMEERYTLEERKSADPKVRAKIQAGVEAAGVMFLKELQESQIPLLEKLLKEGLVEVPMVDQEIFSEVEEPMVRENLRRPTDSQKIRERKGPVIADEPMMQLQQNVDKKDRPKGRGKIAKRGA
jgi:hypothetical protein